MKIIFLFIILVISVSGQTRLSINPGIKLGIAFGDKTQFVFGPELSFVFYNFGKNGGERAGLTLDYDIIDDIQRFHVGVEYMYRIVGIDIGPTLAWKKSKLHYGFSLIPFAGLMILPYFNYTNFEGINDQFEFGSYIKLPIPLEKESLNLGG